MHHPINAGLFTTDDVTKKQAIELQRVDASKVPFVINTEEELQDYLTKKTVRGFPAAKHNALKYLFWVPSESGKDLKMGVIDMDNPAQLSQKELKQSVKIVARTLEGEGRPYIIMFSGSGYQVWFGPTKEEQLGSVRDVQAYVQSRTYSPFLTKDKNVAISERLVHIDQKIYKWLKE